MSTNANPKIAVSYSWTEEREGTHKGAVELFCKGLAKTGANVIRDVDRVKHGECLSTFMRDIGSSNLLCVFLSDSYLKSPNCMYELWIAWQRSKDNPEEFRRRVKVWVMPGSVSIREPEHRLSYTDYWREKRDRLQPLIEKNATDAPGEVTLFRRTREFAENVNDMLVFFSTSLLPATPEEFQKWTQSELPPRATDADSQKIAAVYENTTKEIEKLVNENERLQKFLSKASPGVIQSANGHWTIAETVQRGGVDMCPVLKGIKNELRHYNAVDQSDWKHLLELIGGLITLSVNPGWVLEQRAVQSKFSEYPGKRDSVPYMTDKTASLLPVLSASLADGFVQLERVFGLPDLIPDPPVVLRGVLKTDRETELKLHFIKYILGPSVQLDQANKSEIDDLFENARDVLRYASEELRAPRYAASEAYRQLAPIIRENLRLEHLLLIFPRNDGGVRDVLTDPVTLFSHAFEIFSKLKHHLVA